jgi:hypothetical protein
MKRTPAFADEAPTDPAPSQRNRRSDSKIRIRKPRMIIREVVTADLRKDARRD